MATSLKVDLTDKSNFSTYIIIRLFSSHNLGLTAILMLMAVLFILKNTVYQILYILFCGKKALKYKSLTRGTDEDSILQGNYIILYNYIIK